MKEQRMKFLLAFRKTKENSALTMVSTEKPKYKYMLEFPSKLRVYTNDEQFLLNTLEKYGTSGLPNIQQDTIFTHVFHARRPREMKKKEALIQPLRSQKCPECGSARVLRNNEGAEIVCTDCGFTIDTGKFIGILDATHPGKPKYEIREDEKSYKIISSRSKNRAKCATVNRDTVEKVYRYLKKDGRKRSALDIEKALHVSMTTVHNALKVLRVQRKADLRIIGTKRQFFYKAL